MDAAPPPANQCEAPLQDVLLRVSGKPDARNWSAFVADVRHLDGDWVVVSLTDAAGTRELVLRANPDVSYRAVANATSNANARGFETRLTSGAPRCAGET
jgi:hypothetical protein